MHLCGVDSNKCRGICKQIHEEEKRKCPALYFQWEEDKIKKNTKIDKKKVDFLDL